MVSFLFLGCQGRFLGKTFPHVNYAFSDRTGHHHIAMEHLELDYDYVIDNKAETITFDGTIKYYPKEIPLRADISRITFETFFLDKDKKVIKVFSFPMYDQKISETVPFKKSFPYDRQYAFVTFAYSGVISEY